MWWKMGWGGYRKVGMTERKGTGRVIPKMGWDEIYSMRVHGSERICHLIYPLLYIAEGGNMKLKFLSSYLFTGLITSMALHSPL